MIAERILKRCFIGGGEKHPTWNTVPQEEQQRLSAVLLEQTHIICKLFRIRAQQMYHLLLKCHLSLSDLCQVENEIT